MTENFSKIGTPRDAYPIVASGASKLKFSLSFWLSRRDGEKA